MLPIVRILGYGYSDGFLKLTFKATAFEAGSDNTYSVNIKAEFRFMTGPSSIAYTQTTEKTITVTVTKNPDNGEHVPTFRITTANVSTPENTDFRLQKPWL
jgi:hypothetical protein